jgi:hypothetical protein
MSGETFSSGIKTVIVKNEVNLLLNKYIHQGTNR